jgi:four helix bundle protein
MRDYTKIKAWQIADDLTVAIYKSTQSFPKQEVYSLTSQLRRAVYSVPANIAEGSSRESKKDYLHFLYIARGSLSEAQYFVHLSRRLAYLTEEEAADLDPQIRLTFGCLHGLILGSGKRDRQGRKSDRCNHQSVSHRFCSIVQ